MGQARVAENWRQQHPGVEITRTQTWLATHTPKNGSARCEYRERVASFYDDNPSIANKDLDHDVIALILDRDNRGRIPQVSNFVSSIFELVDEEEFQEEEFQEEADSFHFLNK
ncbi:hypothetical protein AAC387_Pa05g0640 [Persea americana]